MNPKVWSTMMVLYFYCYVAIDQKKEWFNTYERSYRWLWAQLKGNESLKKECLDIVKSFIKEYYGVGDDVVEMDRAFEKEISEMVESIKHPLKDRGIGNKIYLYILYKGEGYCGAVKVQRCISRDMSIGIG
ncbi:hypothetical protein F8M41_001430 [Gigaspora margarita]|uniref:Uncharacterized protein n=1 Tax=Gigaspora margarita TaxID=4874 RepID=A0A8H4ESG3_GIGMA|nr:hypothetical protein F8M41_001430 [Gigaspora margarita]